MPLGFLQRKISTQVKALLKQGLSPERLALSMACGITISCFPIIGCTTAICIAIALVFRLNQLVIQLGNWLAYPLQIVLIVPFILLGEEIFGPTPNLNPKDIVVLFQTDAWKAFDSFSRVVLHTVAAWGIVAPIAIVLLSLILLPIFKHLRARMDKGDHKGAPLF